MKVAAALHPLLFAVFPLLSLFAQNQTDIELSTLWWPLAICIVAAAAVFGACLAVTRQPAKAGVIASLLLVSFFYFGLFSDRAGSSLSTGVQLAIWLGATAALLVVIARTQRHL